jgi:hypothetical protein
MVKCRYRSAWGDSDVDSDEGEIDDGFIAIPHKNDLDLGCNLVFRFANQILPGRVDQIAGFFRKKGAYSRFKDLPASEGLLERWYAFEAAEQEAALREWCAENDIAIVCEDKNQVDGRTTAKRSKWPDEPF